MRNHPGRVAQTPLAERKIAMLYTIALFLVVLWLLGLFMSFTAGGLIHVLLVVAIVVVVLRLFSGRGAV